MLYVICFISLGNVNVKIPAPLLAFMYNNQHRVLMSVCHVKFLTTFSVFQLNVRMTRLVHQSTSLTLKTSSAHHQVSYLHSVLRISTLAGLQALWFGGAFEVQRKVKSTHYFALTRWVQVGALLIFICIIMVTKFCQVLPTRLLT